MPIKTTVQDAALEQIIELIQRKEIFPGTRLFETDLEKSLGMSRTPIRGALDQLVVDGILEKKQNQRGYFFPKLSLSDLYEAYIFRERLEVMSVTLACLKWNHQTGKKIYEALKIENEKNDTQISDTYKDLSDGFHVTLAASSENEYLVRSLKQVYLRICMYELFYGIGVYRVNRNQDLHKGLNDQMILQHEDIVASIAQRDSINAVKKMVRHLRNTVVVSEHVKSFSEWEDYERVFSL
ncbi:MAG: GntR family transcriptional regulator [bacterium]|nr:GntR family transcriptional regulator [bacterium]